MVIQTGNRLYKEPQPKQYQFLTRTEDEVLYGGAAFGGKSEALLMFAIRRRDKYPGSDGMIIRRSFTDLTKPGALIDKSHEILGQRRDVAWDGQNHRWRFASGSVLAFGYLDNSEDRRHYQGAVLEDICWDELTQVANEEDYQFVNAFCRSKIAGCRPLIRAATNPGEVGHAWVRARFLDNAPPFETYTDPRSGRTRCYIPATLDDNPAGLELNPDYEQNLMSLPDALRRALRFGDWDIFVGQVFTEWRRDIHVCTPFVIPDDWTRWIAIDYGYANPFCCLWFARSPEKDHIYVYRELYRAGWDVPAQTAAIEAASGTKQLWVRLADPSMWQKREGSAGNSLAGDYASKGLTLTSANNNRLAGLQWVHDALKWAKYTDGRWLLEPKLQVFEGCTNLIRTVPSLPYDRIRVEDVDTDTEDHAYDALRYGLSIDHLPLPQEQRQVRVTVPTLPGKRSN